MLLVIMGIIYHYPSSRRSSKFIFHSIPHHSSNALAMREKLRALKCVRQKLRGFNECLSKMRENVRGKVLRALKIALKQKVP